MNEIYKDDPTSSAITMRQKIPEIYNTYHSVRLVGWPIKGTKINSAQGTRTMSPVIPNVTQIGRVL
jgi:hypothetical protein